MLAGNGATTEEAMNLRATWDRLFGSRATPPTPPCADEDLGAAQARQRERRARINALTQAHNEFASGPLRELVDDLRLDRFGHPRRHHADHSA